MPTAKGARGTTRELCKLLRKHGFVVKKKGGKGSHIRMEKQLPNRTLGVTIPNHKGRAIRPGTLIDIIEYSEIPRSELLASVPTAGVRERCEIANRACLRCADVL